MCEFGDFGDDGSWLSTPDTNGNVKQQLPDLAGLGTVENFSTGWDSVRHGV